MLKQPGVGCRAGGVCARSFVIPGQRSATRDPCRLHRLRGLFCQIYAERGDQGMGPNLSAFAAQLPAVNGSALGRPG